MKYSKSFFEFRPHTDNDNAENATKKCLELCKFYSWCYAAEVVLRDIWPTPECGLVTDRQAFEKIYGQGQNYEWGNMKSIDDIDYQTYCGGAGCTATAGGFNWNGGKVDPREGYFCYNNTGSKSSLSLSSKIKFV